LVTPFPIVDCSLNSAEKFIKEGISLGRRPDLVGGGLVRSAGGWLAVKELRKTKGYVKGDERIPGRAGTRGKHVIDVEKTECVNYGGKQVRGARRRTG